MFSLSRELVLVEFSGHMNSYYVSLTGYKERSSYAHVSDSCHSLLLAAGGPDHPLTGNSKLVAGLVLWLSDYSLNVDSGRTLSRRKCWIGS